MLGDTAMHKLASSDVFVAGIGGLGLEIGEYALLFNAIRCMYIMQ